MRVDNISNYGKIEQKRQLQFLQKNFNINIIRDQ